MDLFEDSPANKINTGDLVNGKKVIIFGQIEAELQISATNQKLLLLGRPLNNEQTIASYPNIKEGTKLNLVVIKPCLRDSILRGFRKHYSEPLAERMTNEFMADFERKINEQSLDDLERLADSIVNRAAT